MRDKTPTRATLLAGAIAVAAVGFFPAVAHADDSAASAVSDAGGLSYTAAAGQANSATITQQTGEGGATEIVIDDAVTITPGKGCAYADASDVTRVVCTLGEGAGLTIALGDLNDRLTIRTDAASTVWGEDGGDTLKGTDAATLMGGTGNDTLLSAGSQYGGLGNDTVYAGGENHGGRGNDSITATPGYAAYGDGGNDWIFGTNDADLIYGGTGSDYVEAYEGDDTVYGNDGSDYLAGGKGDDSLYGGAQADVILGNSGDDLIRGGSGRDYLTGGPGTNDVKN